MNKQDKKVLVAVTFIIGLFIFFVFALPVYLYFKGHKHIQSTNADNLVKTSEQVEKTEDSTTENSSGDVDSQEIEIVDLKDIPNKEIESLDIPPIDIDENKPDGDDSFYSQIKKQLKYQETLPKLKIPAYYYQIKDNYIKNCADESGKLHIFKRQPILIYVPKGDYYDAITQAFVAYNNQFKGLITFNTVKDPKDSDIQITLTDDLSNARDNRVLGLGGPRKFDKDGNIIYSRIRLLTEYNGRPVNDISIYNTVLHEIGHAIGIAGHSENSDDVMFKHADANDSTKIKYFSQRDIETIKIIYSGNNYLLTKAFQGAQKEKLKENLNYAKFYNKDTDAYIEVAHSYYEMGQFNKALAEYKKALNINPDNSRIYVNIARCYFAEKKYNESLSYSNLAIEKAKTGEDKASAYNMAGISYANLGKYKKALPCYYNALTLYPQESAYFYNYISLCDSLGNYKEAKEAYDTYYSLYKESYFSEKELKKINKIKDYDSKTSDKK